jgi:hypothetical protein
MNTFTEQDMKDYAVYTTKAFKLNIEPNFKHWCKERSLSNNITRFEVIDHTWAGTGRAFAHYGCSVELSYQDDGKTLKVILKEK